MQIFGWIFSLKDVNFKHFLTFFFWICWRLYFRISLLPLSLIDNAKVRQKSDICKLFRLKKVNAQKIPYLSSQTDKEYNPSKNYLFTLYPTRSTLLLYLLSVLCYKCFPYSQPILGRALVMCHA